VEHPVTELVSGVDIVRWQLRVAAGEPLGFTQVDVAIHGHSIECRINAEDPDSGFAPSPGTLTEWVAPAGDGVRVDTFAHVGAIVAPYYDSMVGKLIVHARDRPAALDLMLRALNKTRVGGVATTIPLHRAILGHSDFRRSPVTTQWLESTFLPIWETRHDASAISSPTS
jgi:acetyl-CoA carboxylase biotin carboxylase subunit